MARRYDTVTFLTDYGRVDEFVGVVHSVIRGIAPHAQVIDLSHDVPAHDVRAGGLLLARSAPYLCAGVVVAVIDPGVGTTRRAVAVEVGDGMSVLVGPDNGLLAPAVALCGGADRAVELTASVYQLDAPGPTFAGRDVFAPAAAHLCNGVDLAELGPAVDPAGLLPGVLPVSRVEGDRLVTEVLWVDTFGNAQLNVDPDELAGLAARVGPRGRAEIDRVRLHIGPSAPSGDAFGRAGPRVEVTQMVASSSGGIRDVRTARWVASYADLGPGEIGLVVDSYGLVSIALDRASASAELGVRTGTEVQIELLTDASGEQEGVNTPVRIGSRPPAADGGPP